MHPHRPFIEAVTRQLTRPRGAVVVPLAEREEREESVGAAVLYLLEAASRGAGSEAFERAARVLQADTELLSSVFQNLDLFDVHDVIGGQVALLVSEALSAPPASEGSGVHSPG